MATSVIGKGVDRIDGEKKVTGAADYAADRVLDRMVYGYGVMSTVGSASSVKIDASAALAAPGVVVVYHHGNLPKLYRSSNDWEAQTTVGEVRPPFEDDKVYYAGQFVALVVAESFEQARAASALVKAEYAIEPPGMLWTDKTKVAPNESAELGDPDADFELSEWCGEDGQEVTYCRQGETHKHIEM